MKIRLKKFYSLLLLGSVLSPSILLVACSSVDGKIEYKVVGLNKEGTDYVVEVNANKQFISRIIVENRKNINLIDQKIKTAILEQIKAVYPDSYKKGEYKDLDPVVKPISKTKFEILFPIKKIITKLPKLSKIISDLQKKYNHKKLEELKKIKQELIESIYMKEIKQLEKDKKLQEFFNSNYKFSRQADAIVKKDYVDFNYIGIAPYMAGEATDEILSTTLGLKNDNDVASFLAKHFEGKKNGDQEKLEVTLPNTFPIVEFRNQSADVYFYIDKIKGDNDTFESAKKDKATLNYSLFLKKDYNLNIGAHGGTELEVKSATKLSKTDYKTLFEGLKVGKQISRVVELDGTKDDYKFTYESSGGQAEDDLKDAEASKLFDKKVIFDGDKEKKNEDDKKLYSTEMAKKYKAILTFDLVKVESRKDDKSPWVKKSINTTVEEGDRVTIANYKLQYYGLPFEKGAAENYKTYNGFSGFISTFDKQMEGMTGLKKRFITPIFPTSYNNKELAGKLVKFIIKVNEVRKRKQFSLALLKENEVMGTNKKKITTIKQLDDEIIRRFKEKLYGDIVRGYLTKVDVKIPSAAIQQFYQQVFIQLYTKTFKQPKRETVIKEATQKAKAQAMLVTFFNSNKIKGDTIKKQKDALLDQIYNEIA